MDKHAKFILGNPSLHAQLSTALAVMTQLICNASTPPSAQQLSESLDIPTGHLRKLLRTLTVGGLLQPHEHNSDTWMCTRAPHAISLADIYHCLLADNKEEEGTDSYVSMPQADASISAAELLMMQATMTINQAVFQQLQQFDLGRLKIAESAMLFSVSLRDKMKRIHVE